MRYLPLYPEAPVAPVEAEEPRLLDLGCKRCALHEGARTVCMAADGAAGGLLVVGESPGRTEDSVGRPFVGPSGEKLRRLLAQWWSGPVAIANAVGCCPGNADVEEKHVEACRGYLAQTLREARPTRVVTLGSWAAFAVLGRKVPPMSSRKGYGYLYGGERPIPVFFVLHPAAALRNRFVDAWFREDLRWALTALAPELPPLDAEVRVVETAADAEEAVTALRLAPWSSVDAETAGRMHDSSFRVLCLSLTAAGSDEPWAWDASALRRPETFGPLRDYLEDERFGKRGANVKYDELCAEQMGADVRGPVGDVRLWRKLLEPGSDGHLERMIELVGMGGAKDEQRAAMAPLVGRIKRGRDVEARLAKNAAEDAAKAARGEQVRVRPKLTPAAAEGLAALRDLDVREPELAKLVRDRDIPWEAWGYALAPEDVLLRYNGRDAASAGRLGLMLEARLAEVPSVDRIRRLVVDRAARAVRKLEGCGIAVDLSALRQFEAYLDGEIDRARAQLLAAAGQGFNPASPVQVRKLLFETLGLRPTRRTETGLASTAAEVLEEFGGRHPVAGALLAWRKFERMQTHYARGMRGHVRADGRIHTSILLDGAETGRSSSVDPNLQNIPRAADSPEGKMARDVFIARPGYLLLNLDYSQIELRKAAELSGDPEMIKIFLEGVDYHLRTAQLVARQAWGIEPDQVGKPERTFSKTTNFSVLYGATVASLAARLKIPIAQAQRAYDAIMGKFARLAAYAEECKREVRKTGLAWTYWEGERARRRPLPAIADQDEGRRITAENAALNTPVQGSANEHCLCAMADASEWIEGDGLEELCKLVLPVHDSLMFEVRADFAEEAACTIREIMLAHKAGPVPLVVDAELGRRWGSLEALPLDDRAALDQVLGALRKSA